MAYSWAVCLPEMLLPLQCRASDKVKGPGGSSIDSDSFQLTFTSLCHRRRQWHPTPVPLPGKSHGWRSLVGYSPWGRKDSDTTEQFHFLLCTRNYSRHRGYSAKEEIVLVHIETYILASSGSSLGFRISPITFLLKLKTGARHLLRVSTILTPAGSSYNLTQF